MDDNDNDNEDNLIGQGRFTVKKRCEACNDVLEASSVDGRCYACDTLEGMEDDIYAMFGEPVDLMSTDD